MRLKDKVAVVTGASRGIGRSVALRFAEEGAMVLSVGRNETLLSSLEEESLSLGSALSTHVADISREVDCRKVIERAIHLYGKIDVLVNAAGLLGKRVGLLSLDEAEWDLVFNTNVAAVFRLTKYAAHEMILRKEGSIINVTSGVVSRPNSNWGPYLPSKFAVEGMTLMFADELKSSGVRVNMIDPGRTRTDMIRQAYPELDPASIKPPEAVTDAFLFLASDESKHVTGTRIRVN